MLAINLRHPLSSCSYYNSYAKAKKKGLVSISKSGAVTLRVGTKKNQAMRDSIRLVGCCIASSYRYHPLTSFSPFPRPQVSKKTHDNGGLFIFDIAHIPVAYGAWPALWSTGWSWVSTAYSDRFGAPRRSSSIGSDSAEAFAELARSGPSSPPETALTLSAPLQPNDGEIDIIEGVHAINMNSMSTHTGPGCTMGTSGFSGKFMMATAQKNQCNVYASDSQGCGVRSASKSSYGPNFNKKGGGVFALLWAKEGIKIYQWPRNKIPADVSSCSHC